ncbi:MAG: hypothetical protein QJR08_04320 [Bacillota bacterium]|nr:hypothetical protein [Bacillota bacterium]
MADDIDIQGQAPDQAPPETQTSTGTDQTPPAAPEQSGARTFTQEDIDRIISRRLAEEREKGAKLGPDEQELLDIWRQVREHPDAEAIRAEWQEALNRYLQVDPAEAAARKVDEVAKSTELRLAEMELRLTDPVFKEHEQEIKEWARSSGLRIRTAQDLRLAMLAWQGTQLPKLQADLEVRIRKAVEEQLRQKQAATLPTGGSAQTPPVNPKEMSDVEWLRSQGLNPFRE